MNKRISTLIVALVAACPLAGFGQSSLEHDPAYLRIDQVFDLKTLHPKVNVNLPRFLLQDAAADLNGGAGDPFAGAGVNFADVIKDVKLIRVVVIEATETNRAALQKAVKTLRATLEAKWTPIVTVPENNVGVYALGDPAGDSMAGLAVLVFNGDDAVVGNVVGRVSIGKLIKVAAQMHKLPKDFLKNLGGTNGRSIRASAPAASGVKSGGAKDSGKSSEEAPKKAAPAK